MMAAGAAIAAVPGGQVVGLAVAALGADQVAAGVSKVVTNGQVESNLHNGLKAVGGKEFADNGEAAITTVIPVAGEYAVLNRMGLWGRPWAVPRPGSGAPAERGGLAGDATRASPSKGKTGERSPELQQALERADDLAPHADVLSTQWKQHSQAERLEGLPADAARARQAASAAAHGADRGFLNLDPVTPGPQSTGTGGVWVQFDTGGAIREYHPQDLAGDLAPGRVVRTPDGPARVLTHGEPPTLAQVEQPLLPEPMPSVEAVARKIAYNLREEVVKTLSKPGRSGGAIGAQADKRVGAEMIRMANSCQDDELAAQLRTLGKRLINRGKSGVHK